MVGGHDAELRVVPADQRLDADDSARDEIELRLVPEGQLVAGESDLQFGQQGQPADLARAAGASRHLDRIARPLGGVHRQVGGLDQRGGVGAVVRPRRHPDAGCDREREADAGERFADHGEQLFRSTSTRPRVEATLVISNANSSPPMRAAISPWRCRPPNRIPSSRQHAVADRVTEPVVDLLEPVEVDQHERAASARLTPAELVGEACHERPPVEQRGQLVVIGFVLVVERRACAAVDEPCGGDDEGQQEQAALGDDCEDRRQRHEQRRRWRC